MKIPLIEPLYLLEGVATGEKFVVVMANYLPSLDGQLLTLQLVVIELVKVCYSAW